MIEYVFTYVTSRMGPPLGIITALFVSVAIVAVPYVILDVHEHPILSWFWLIGSSILMVLIWMGVAEYYGGAI